MIGQHKYHLKITWTGNTGDGTKDYRSYNRNHIVSVENKPDLLCSSDPSFRGDNTKYNPEELLVASISGCHMLSFLHLCAIEGIVVVEYIDVATGTMQQTPDGGGHFTEVTLHPNVIVRSESMIDKANQLHQQANKLCFIANSCNFPVYHKSTCIVRRD